MIGANFIERAHIMSQLHIMTVSRKGANPYTQLTAF